MLKAKQPDVEFVTEQAPPLGKIDAGPVAQAIDDAKPDAIFNVRSSAPISLKFVREGSTRGVFKDRSCRRRSWPGEPEYLRAAQGRGAGRVDRHRLSVASAVTVPPHNAQFLAAYQKRYGDHSADSARSSAIVTMKSLAAGIAKAGSTDTDKLDRGVQGPCKLDGPLRTVPVPRRRPPGDARRAIVGTVAA